MPSHYAPSRTDLAPGLYLVATPIGNLGDMTLRALNILASVDLIACEDTRVSKKLLNHYGIHAHLELYHEHNAAIMRPKLLEKLKKNATIALISDAGTPLISDPGYKLVKEVMDAEITIHPIPGASSVLTALLKAGLPTDKFSFLGFLPASSGEAEHLLTMFQSVPTSLVLFSTASKIEQHITLCRKVLGDREAVICRELTKLYEEAIPGTLQSLSTLLSTGKELRGEMALVIAPPAHKPVVDDAMLDAAIREHLSRMPLKSAAQEVASMFDLPKNKVYQRALQLK